MPSIPAKKYLRSVLIFAGAILIFKGFAQTPFPIKINWDTNYYVIYTEELTTRLYTSTKYSSIRLINPQQRENLLYTPNNNIILGFGATYSIFTLNIGLNFPFVNEADKDIYGESVYLDLQTHIYTTKVTLDLYAQLYKGKYLRNSSGIFEDWPHQDTFYIRPDITTHNLGFNAQYIFNYRKFSYRAAYLQNSWQKKSAGSWVVGTNVFYITHTGDSLIIPTNIDPPNMFNDLNFKRKDALNIGVSGGYYYNLVMAKNLFFSIGLAGGPGLGYTWLNKNENLPTKYSGVNMSFNAVVRASLGYNSRRLFIGTFFLNQFLLNKLPGEHVWSNSSTGNFRIIIAYRFKLKKPIKFANVRYWNFLYKDSNKKEKSDSDPASE